jgi:hypothetical protein
MLLDRDKLERYFAELYGGPVRVKQVSPIGVVGPDASLLKEYGYGANLKIELEVGGEPRKVVLSTVKPGGFGHDHMSDRAAIVLWQHEAFNALDRHVKAIDVGGFTDQGLKSVRDVREFFLVTEHIEGAEYARDLDRIKASGLVTPLDLQRVKMLARYLAEIHAVKKDAPGYYERRTRELIGHNECLFGLTDSYPADYPGIPPAFLADLEKRCIDWRWKNKRLTHRLSQIHGDFHPFNILFRDGIDFTALDRSRGAWGEPADDLAGLSINYLFWGLLHRGTLEGPFRELWDTFFDTYLEASKDEEVLEVIQPYLAWRAIIVASPMWYPNYAFPLRRMILRFARNILEEAAFRPRDVEALLGERG